MLQKAEKGKFYLPGQARAIYAPGTGLAGKAALFMRQPGICRQKPINFS
jgi:hypothetical protein